MARSTLFAAYSYGPYRHTVAIIVSNFVFAILLLLPVCANILKSDCTRCVCYECNYACCYEVDTTELFRLDIEVNCSKPEQAVVEHTGYFHSDLAQQTTCSGYRLHNIHSCLATFPENACDYGDKMKTITISWTSLSDFPALACFPELRLLDLAKNKLTYVPRDAFRGLEKLFEIRLDYNQITYIHPNAFDVPLPYLNKLSVTHNKLVSVELWILNMHHRFCIFDFRYNRLQRLTNERKAKVDLSPHVKYGPGYVDLRYNEITAPPLAQFGQYGITPIAFLGKFIEWGFDARDNPFHCDCNVYDIVFWIRRLETVIKRDYFDLTCATPDKFNGYYIRDLPAEELTCVVTKNCPHNCSCFQRPATHDVLVNCSGQGLAEFPKIMPNKHKLTILLNNNSLTDIQPTKYLKQARRVNISDNQIEKIDPEVPRLLKRAQYLDLRGNAIRELPHTFQVMSPDAVYLDPDTLHCSCDLTWFPAWAEKAKILYFGDVVCRHQGGRVPLINATREDLDCPDTEDLPASYKLSLICVAGMIVVVVIALVIFRYEVLVLTNVLNNRFKSHKELTMDDATSGQTEEARPLPYDVFLSSADDSETDTEWMCSKLLPAIERHALKCYWPCRDCLPGSIEIEETTKGIHSSRTALVVLSPDYVNNSSCRFQFTQAYTHMISKGRGKLILLYLRQVSRCAVQEPRLRAMITLRMYRKAETPGSLERVIEKLTP